LKTLGTKVSDEVYQRAPIALNPRLNLVTMNNGSETTTDKYQTIIMQMESCVRFLKAVKKQKEK